MVREIILGDPEGEKWVQAFLRGMAQLGWRLGASRPSSDDASRAGERERAALTTAARLSWLLGRICPVGQLLVIVLALLALVLRARRYVFHPDEVAEAEALGLPYALVPRVLSKQEWLERYATPGAEAEFYARFQRWAGCLH